MQMFGLVSLLLVIALAAIWMSSSMGGVVEVHNEDGTVTTESTYGEAVDQAGEAARMMER